MVWPFTSSKFEESDEGRPVFDALNQYATKYIQALEDPSTPKEAHPQIVQTFKGVTEEVRKLIGSRMSPEAFNQALDALPAFKQPENTMEPGLQEAWNPMEIALVGGLAGPVTRGAASLATKAVGKPLLKSATSTSESFLRPTLNQLLNAATATSAVPESGTGIAGGTAGDILGTAASTALASKIPGVSPQQAKGLLGLALKGGKEVAKYGAKRALPVAGAALGSTLGSAAEQKLRKGDVDWTAAGIEGAASSIFPGFQAAKQIKGDAASLLRGTVAGQTFIENALANKVRSTARNVFASPEAKTYGYAFDKIMQSGVKVPSAGRENLITGYLDALTPGQRQAIGAKLRVAPRPRGLDMTRSQLNSFHDDMMTNFMSLSPADKPMSHLVRWRQSVAGAARNMSAKDSILTDQLNDLVHVIDEHIDEGLKAAETQAFIFNKARQASGPAEGWAPYPNWQAGERTGSWEPVGRRARPTEMPTGMPEGNPDLRIQREPLTPQQPLALPPGRPGMRDIGQRTRAENLPAVRGERLPMETPNWRPGTRPTPGEVPGSGWQPGNPETRAYNPRAGQGLPSGQPGAAPYARQAPRDVTPPGGVARRPKRTPKTPMDDWNLSPAQAKELYDQANKGYWFFRAQEGLEDLVSRPAYTGLKANPQRGDYRNFNVNELLNALESPVGPLATDVVDRLSRVEGAYEELTGMLRRLRDQNLTVLRKRVPEQTDHIIPNFRRAIIGAMLSPQGRAMLEESIVRGKGVIPNRELARIVNQSRRAMGLTPEVENRN